MPHDSTIDRDLEHHDAAYEPEATDAADPGSEAADPVSPPPEPRAPRRSVARPRMPDKTPGLAAMLSVVTGLGNVYNGLYVRGVAFFFLWASLFGLAVQSGDSGREENLAFLVPSMIFFWLFNLFDAYRQAVLINLGLTEEDEPPARRSPASDLMLGVALLVVGLYGIVVKYFDLDLVWILDNWPLAVTAFGGWLVYQAWKQRRAEEGSAGGPY